MNINGHIFIGKLLRKVLLLAFISCILFVIAAGAYVKFRRDFTRKPVCDHCNVIFIVIDTLRADTLPCYGYALPTAPSLCKFAGQSTMFSQAYANSSWTLPSTMSIFTSLLAKSHGLNITMENALNSNVPTLPEQFLAAGYETVFISDADLNIVRDQGFGRGFNYFQYSSKDINAQHPRSLWLSAIDQVKAQNAVHKPSFVFLHTDVTHDYLDMLDHLPMTLPLNPEYTPPPLSNIHVFTKDTWNYAKDAIAARIQDLGNSDEEGAKYKVWLDALIRAKNVSEAKTVFQSLPEPIQTRIAIQSVSATLGYSHPDQYAILARHLYDEGVRKTDKALSTILERIEQNGLTQNSIIVITSDHGELLGEHGLIGHSLTMYEGELHIPLIIYLPKHPPKVTSDFAQLIDLYPTLMALTGLPIPRGLSGTNLFSSLTTPHKRDPHEAIVSEWLNDRSLITDNWHLIESIEPKSIKYELYDRKTDPKETQSRAKDLPEVKFQLMQTLHKVLENVPTYRPEKKSILDTLSPDLKTELIEDGYFL